MIDYYDTFLQGEAVQKLKAYCDRYHKNQDPEKPLFYTDSDNPMNGERLSCRVKVYFYKYSSLFSFFP